MAFDVGGPVNKAAYTFAVGLLASKVYGPMAAVMAAGMTPPLGLALAATLFKDRFTQEERDAAKAAAVLGISFVTEGAIPFAARDPLRVVPCLVAGSVVTGAISLAANVEADGAARRRLRAADSARGRAAGACTSWRSSPARWSPRRRSIWSNGRSPDRLSSSLSTKSGAGSSASPPAMDRAMERRR